MCCGHHGHHRHPERGASKETVVDASREVRTCPTCGKPVQDDFVVCPYCGTQLKRSCPSCGRTVDVNWKVCAYCGADLTAVGTQPESAQSSSSG